MTEIPNWANELLEMDKRRKEKSKPKFKVQIAVREVKYSEGYRADVKNINAYIKHITGTAPAKYDHHMRYDFGDSPGEVIENLLCRLKNEDGFTGTWEEV